MKRLCIALALITGILTGCASSQAPVDTTNFNDLVNLSRQQIVAEQPTGSKIRLQAIKETAMTLGAQGGLAWRAEQLNTMLESNRSTLSQVFNFNGLLLDKNILPPVLEQSNQSLNLANSTSLRIADRTYKIIQQARFVTTAPNWDQYLLMQYKKPEVPDSTLLPRNAEERKLWAQNIETGWQQGIDQANNIYAANLARLKRDYNGMTLYRKLLAQQMVSKPRVVQYNMGVTGDNDEMRINDQSLQITATPKFETNTKQWQPALIQN
ncbi:MAG: type IV secretory system conjugative DNA transfer family protein [Pseudomonadota bacterium]